MVIIIILFGIDSKGNVRPAVRNGMRYLQAETGFSRHAVSHAGGNKPRPSPASQNDIDLPRELSQEVKGPLFFPFDFRIEDSEPARPALHQEGLTVHTHDTTWPV